MSKTNNGYSHPKKDKKKRGNYFGMFWLFSIIYKKIKYFYIYLIVLFRAFSISWVNYLSQEVGFYSPGLMDSWAADFIKTVF